jgi:general secretion pathway protein F
MRFRARVLLPNHRVEWVDVVAEDERAASGVLASKGRQVLLVEPVKRSLADVLLPIGRGGLPKNTRFDPTLFVQELHALLSAGLSLAECFEALIDKHAKSAAGGVVERLRDTVRSGQRLSQALRLQPSAFPGLLVGLVQAAEDTSDLPRALSQYLEHRSRIDILRHRLISASIYPAILLFVGFAVVLFLLAYVVPKFALVYQGTGRDIPWLSQLLLDVGRTVGENPLAAATGAAGLLAMGLAASTYAVRSGWLYRSVARWPAVGQRLHTFALARHYLTLGVLLQGGIPLVPALKMVAESASVGQRVALLKASDRVIRGEPLSQAMSTEGLTTGVSLRLLRVGERSGDMSGMLRRAAEFYDADIARLVDRTSRVIEPLLMAIIGLIVGAIVVLLYLPIIDLVGSLG